MKFNESSIMVGYIQELLRSINLPCVPVKDTVGYYDGLLYICKDGIYRDNIKINTYIFNRPYLNITKVFKPYNTEYDAYTHKFLGNFLRFYRDFTGVNLMPLYNCFSNESLHSVNDSIYIREPGTQVSDNRRLVATEVNTSDGKYNYYSVPVKAGQKYTIAINALEGYELFAIKQIGSGLTNYDRTLGYNTYEAVNNSFATQPYLYTKLENEQGTDLKLVIKILKSNRSAIVVLEGDYISNAPKATIRSTTKGISNISNNTNLKQCIYTDTELSLLDLDTTYSKPYADRLEEYLFGNVITSEEEIEKNILRIQNRVYEDFFKGTADIFDSTLKKKIAEVQEKEIKQASFKMVKSNNDYYPQLKFLDMNKDLLGLVDKDTETLINSNRG